MKLPTNYLLRNHVYIHIYVCKQLIDAIAKASFGFRSLMRGLMTEE